MTLVLPAILCLASGFALVSLGWGRVGPFATNLLLRISISIGFGLGIFSVVYFFALVFNFGNLLLIDLVVCAVLVAAWAVQLRIELAGPDLAKSDSEKSSSEKSGSEKSDSARLGSAEPGGGTSEIKVQWPVWLHRTLTAAFVISLGVALYSGIIRMLSFPHGEGWDAFAIWNLHARFLFLGGDHWRDGFIPMVGGSHPDYPLLLPAAIAHFWKFLGYDDPRVPAIIAILFTFATVSVLFAALSILRGQTHAMMAAIALLSTPFFIEHGTAQYADVPLSFFLLVTVAMLCLFDGSAASSGHRLGWLVLAGFSAGFAAWTKNEGLLFLCAIVVSRVLIVIRAAFGTRDQTPQAKVSSWPAPSWAHISPLFAALVPGLLLVIYYKHFIGVPGDLFSDPATALPKLLDPHRYWVILAGYVKSLFRFGHWLLIPGTVLLAGLPILFGGDVRGTRQPGFRTSVLALILTLTGYFAVFLVTPYDLHWHLRFSLARLFLQLWPSTVFLFFLTLRGPSEPSRIAT